MENKKKFGEYILQRRKELGMTQKQFAQKLFVTESAVSKWERGLSYPDITLLQTICSVLDITEHELLSGSEDTQKRTSEVLAEKYQKITRNYRWSQYVFYGLVLAGCAVGNLIAAQTLDWFFIVLAGVLMAASLTLAPALAALHPKLCRCKLAIAFAGFTLSFELLFLTCCIFTGSGWFPVAGISVLFGMTLVCLPFLLPSLPLPDVLAHRRISCYLLLETALLILLLLVCCIYTGGDWFGIAAVSVLFGLGFFILPVLLRQLPVPDGLNRHKVLLYFTGQTALLVVLLAVIYIPADAGEFWGIALPCAGLGLVLPWGIMLAVRYLPINGWFRAAVCVLWSGVWVWLFPFALQSILYVRYGGPVYNPYTLWMWTQFDFTDWTGNQGVFNWFAIIILGTAALAAVLAGIGLHRKTKQC